MPTQCTVKRYWGECEWNWLEYVQDSQQLSTSGETFEIMKAGAFFEVIP